MRTVAHISVSDWERWRFTVATEMPDRAVVEERWKQASKNYFFHPTEENRKARDAAEKDWRAQPAVVTLALSWRAASYLERTIEADIEASKRWLREHGQAHKLERPIFAEDVLEDIQRQLGEQDA